jgi:hypothetical protein
VQHGASCRQGALGTAAAVAGVNLNVSTSKRNSGKPCQLFESVTRAHLVVCVNGLVQPHHLLSPLVLEACAPVPVLSPELYTAVNTFQVCGST